MSLEHHLAGIAVSAETLATQLTHLDQDAGTPLVTIKAETRKQAVHHLQTITTHLPQATKTKEATHLPNGLTIKPHTKNQTPTHTITLTTTGYHLKKIHKP